MDDPRSKQEKKDAGDPESGARDADLEPAGDTRDAQAGPRADRYAGAYGEELEASDLSRYLRVLYKRRWTAATAFLIVALVGTVRSFRTPPVYEARVRVLVETERLNLIKIEDVVVETQTAETQQAILQSRWLAGKTLESRGMLGEPAAPRSEGMEDAQADGISPGSLWSAVTEPVREFFGGQSTPSRAISGAELGPREVEVGQIDAFLGGLTVTPLKGVFEIRYRSSDPVHAADMGNAHAQTYIEQNLELRFAAIKEVTDWLAARMTEQRQRVNASEQALQRFREEIGLGAVSDLDEPLRAKLNALSTSLTRATAARLEKESLYNKVQALRGDFGSLVRLPPMVADPVVQQIRLELGNLQQERTQLSEKLQERHPDMVKLEAAVQATQAKLEVEVDRVVESVRTEVASARATEASLQKVLDDQEREAVVQNRKNVQAGILEREVESNRQIYDMLVQRARETTIAKEIKPTEIRILDPAEVPRAPILPNHRQDVMRAVFAGLALALALVFGFERLDNRIRLPDEIRTRLGLPLLGLLPEVRAHRGAGPLLLTSKVPPQFLEAVRSLRTNVLFSFADEGLKIVLVTSVGPGEGKTVVAGNLAVALAQAGEQVLVMDADMRRPALHELFGRDRQPGLSNLLVGAKAADVTRRTAVSNLWILPAGHSAPNPPELLGSARFRKFLEALGQHFQWVIIDAPPVLPVTDACVLAHLAQGVLLVVGADRVSRPAARRALEQLDSAGARLVGAVLTRVDLLRHPYYYSGHYYRKYSRYYADSSRR